MLKSYWIVKLYVIFRLIYSTIYKCKVQRITSKVLHLVRNLQFEAKPLRSLAAVMKKSSLDHQSTRFPPLRLPRKVAAVCENARGATTRAQSRQAPAAATQISRACAVEMHVDDFGRREFVAHSIQARCLTLTTRTPECVHTVWGIKNKRLCGLWATEPESWRTHAWRARQRHYCAYSPSLRWGGRHQTADCSLCTDCHFVRDRG